MALGHFVVLVPHDGGAVDIGGDLPAEGLVQQIVLGGGGEVLAAADHVGDAHQVVIHHVCEVIGGQAVPLDKDLVVQGGVFHSDIAKGHIVEGGGTLSGDTLTDDVRLAGGQVCCHFLGAHIAAGVGLLGEVAGILVRLGLLAEAVVSGALFYQEFRVFAVKAAALGLDVGAHGAAHIGAFVVGEAALGHGLVDHVHSAFHQAALVGILNAEDESAAGVAGNEPGVQRGAQIAHVHIAGGRGSETGADLPLGDAIFHFFKELHIQCHERTSMSIKLRKNTRYIMAIWIEIVKGFRIPAVSAKSTNLFAKPIALSFSSCYNNYNLPYCAL